MAPPSTQSSCPAGESLEGRDDAPSLLPGDVIGGKYRVDAHIADGGMGVVLRATHLDLDCPVAIKLLRPEHSHNEDVVARLLTEAKTAASLRSKHVNRVLDVGRTDCGVPYLVLEYLEGSDLGGYLERRGPLPVTEAADYVMQACEALAEAHAIGIVHRDMKPENLFLAEEADGGFVLKVLDFGICKAPPSRRGRTLTNPFEVVGSPTYMSPEQVRGGNVDARTDVWALGAVMHELCTGEIFFDEEKLRSTFSRVLDPNDMPPPLDGGEESARLHAVIVRCLEREPERRFQDMVELAQALAPLGSDPLQATRVAKVAAAARARFIAAAKSGSPLVPTPVALTLTTSPAPRALGSGPHRVSPPRPRLRAWSIVAAAAVAAAVSALQHGAPPVPATAALAPVAVETAFAPPEHVPELEKGQPLEAPRSASAAAAVPLTRPSWTSLPAAREVTRPPSVEPRASVTTARLESPELPPPATPMAHAQTAAAEPEETARALDTAPAVAEEPTAHLQAEAPPADGASPVAPPPLDAWDPRTFGGRE
jgi:eukaryotic-like serine/threonine-protein kinase